MKTNGENTNVWIVIKLFCEYIIINLYYSFSLWWIFLSRQLDREKKSNWLTPKDLMIKYHYEKKKTKHIKNIPDSFPTPQ